MSENKLYPRYAYDALTMLYLSKIDISDLTPSQLVDRYNEVYTEIKKRYSETPDRR